MAKFIVSVTSRVPVLYLAEVEVEAENKEAAYKLVQKMYYEDEIEWTGKEADYDQAEMTVDSIEQLDSE